MAKAIMVQGTASGVGKSLLCAGLCRVFRQDGYRVAPFKSQNMALNSFITREGLEMGRAQVVQAQAAGVEPSVRMNPILLKPQSDTGSQVIVCGEVWDTLPAAEYYARKHALLPLVREAYESLAAECDIVVLEGAGSPAEINLKEGDFVNMGMARLARAPVLLAGDIDRGGVFAALAGTLLLLEGWERRLVKALVINKFRGDVGLLRPGLEMLTARTGVPFAGVVPWLPVDIEEEDSLTGRFSARPGEGRLEVAVVRLPRISNFTDFLPLEAHPDIRLRYVASVRELGQPDLLVLPGTKNTAQDLIWLRESGLESKVLRLAGEGTPVLGICGGYQMLGETLLDPQGTEGGAPGWQARGLGLLPLRTVFGPGKTRTRRQGRFLPLAGPLAPLSGAAVEGYEIHMGESEILPQGGGAPLLELSPLGAQGEGAAEGCVRGNACGTYLHGLFDTAPACEGLVRALCARKGIAPGKAAARDPAAYREEQLDRLADGIRQSLDMPGIYRILQRGVEL